MIIQSNKKLGYERAIFETFLRAHPRFAATVQLPFDQQGEEPADVHVTLTDGSQIDFQLGEWVHEEQIGQAKRREQVAESIEQAIEDQGQNTSEHFRFVMLELRPGGPPLKPGDETTFRAELWSLIAETEARWPSEPFWHDPHGRHEREFSGYPTLRQYLLAVTFYPLMDGANRREQYPAQQPWIVVAPPGGAYASDTALEALDTILDKKLAHYGPLARTTYLLVFFNQACLYNTPWHGLKMDTFGEVAAAAAEMVRDQSRFKKIYLLSAVEPNPEAYEIYPTLVKC